MQFIRMNQEMLSEVERLTEVLKQKELTRETRLELNKTIQCYLQEMRKLWGDDVVEYGSLTETQQLAINKKINNWFHPSWRNGHQRKK